MKKIISGLVVLIVAFGLFAFSVDEYQFEISRNLNIFATLYRELNTHYVDELPNEKIITQGINAMLSSLDPYTSYIPESELESYRTSTTGEYGGIGAVVGKRDNINTILMPYVGFPAHKSGLLIGDQIVKIDGKDVKDDTNSQISEQLKGHPGTKLVLTIKRLGQDESFDVTITREKIVISNVAHYEMFNDKVGYIRLSDFTTNAGAEVKKALQELKGKGAKGIILDLRDNPGGLLEEAIKVANVFIPQGKEVVSTRGKVKSWDKQYKAPYQVVDKDIPLAVLTSGGTASAAEIVSGVIQDYDRGVLLGTRTFGKGLVQATRPLPYNAQLKVTTAKYYIPSGRCIQAIDYSIKNEDGSVKTIPDSLKVAFKTKSGRTVYDGGGIKPDIVITPREYSSLLFNIVNDNLMFEYAGQYYLKNKTIPAARDFHLTDVEYKEFVDWLNGKNVSFSSQMDDAIVSLEKMARKEQYHQGMEESLENLKTKVDEIKSSYLMTFQDEVKLMLEQEIVSRYYFHEGIIESAIHEDMAVAKAVEVLNDPAEYKKILN
ncbi:S41 family peptidase [Reichenbachiella versicolor]|uniref:S41 family peptidase n=1 Tax=Reichenbachiella versicolor TaxID=1821036 RepID=UPI000D6E69DF|nr:S41 family peptidase [Reichenbachiella versicolor]